MGLDGIARQAADDDDVVEHDASLWPGAESVEGAPGRASSPWRRPGREEEWIGQVSGMSRGGGPAARDRRLRPGERVQEIHTRIHDVIHIAGHQCEAVHPGRRSQEPIHHRKHPPGVHAAPLLGDFRRHW